MDLPSPIMFVCANCASPAVVREAWASWNVTAQRWELAELFDYAFCHHCHRRTQLGEQPARE